jgi:hypothetical protein
MIIPLDAWQFYRNYPYHNWHTAWKMARGLAQVKMNWVHDWKDIKRKRVDKIKKV